MSEDISPQVNLTYSGLSQSLLNPTQENGGKFSGNPASALQGKTSPPRIMTTKNSLPEETKFEITIETPGVESRGTSHQNSTDSLEEENKTGQNKTSYRVDNKARPAEKPKTRRHSIKWDLRRGGNTQPDHPGKSGSVSRSRLAVNDAHRFIRSIKVPGNIWRLANTNTRSPFFSLGASW